MHKVICQHIVITGRSEAKLVSHKTAMPKALLSLISNDKKIFVLHARCYYIT